MDSSDCKEVPEERIVAGEDILCVTVKKTFKVVLKQLVDDQAMIRKVINNSDE